MHIDDVTFRDNTFYHGRLSAAPERAFVKMDFIGNQVTSVVVRDGFFCRWCYHATLRRVMRCLGGEAKLWERLQTAWCVLRGKRINPWSF